MKSIRSFIRHVLTENDEQGYELMGGLPATLRNAGSVDTSTPVKRASITAGNQYLKSHDVIFNDVEAALVETGMIGVVMSDDDQYDRLVAIKSLLEKDLLDQTNYPFRAALYTIASNNGIRHFRLMPRGLERTAEEIAAIFSDPAGTVKNINPFQESKSRKQRLNEIDPVTMGLAHAGLHVAADKLLPSAVKAAGAFKKGEIEWLKQNLQTSGTFYNLLKRADDSLLTIPKAGVQPGWKGSAERISKQLVTEPGVKAGIGYDPAEIRAVAAKIEKAIANSASNKTQSDVAEQLQITVADVIQRERPTKDKILESMLGGNNDFFKADTEIDALRVLANAAAAANAATGSAATAEALAAYKFFADLAEAAQTLVEFTATQMLKPTLLRGGKIALTAALWTTLGLHSGSFIYTNANALPEDTSPETIAAIADSAKIRYEATEAQKDIVAMTDYAPEIEKALLVLFGRPDGFNVTDSEISAVIALITALEEKKQMIKQQMRQKLIKNKNQLTPKAYNPSF
jgi:hypothetical protein